MDGICGKRCDPAAVETAKRLGFDGLQVTLGPADSKGQLQLADTAVQSRFRGEAARHKMELVATYLDSLHTFCLKSDPAAMQRVKDGIEITRRLGAPILMLVFFGKCALTTRSEMDAVTGPLKELAPEARKAGVILGFENTIRAQDDLRILEAVASPALKIYYDIGNATNLYGVEPATEIRMLTGHICQFHFKDKGYLGEGKVDVPAALAAMRETRWKGFVVLETGSPSKDIEGDLRKNRQFLESRIHV
jgi:sugar phosphate isomerase/epimerase